MVLRMLQARVTDAVQFGDGFGLAGSVIVHLLGQRQQFELLDFSYHVLNVNNFERCAVAIVDFYTDCMYDESRMAYFGRHFARCHCRTLYS